MLLNIREDTKCDMEVALAWTVSAKNPLTNTHGLSHDKFHLARTVPYPVLNSLFPQFKTSI